MISLYRLKGRALQVDNALILFLSFMTGSAIICTVNLLPVLYKGITVDYQLSDVRLAELIFSFIFFLTSLCIYSSLRLGMKRYFFKRATKKKAGVSDIFFFFRVKNCLSALCYSVKTAVLKIALFIICFSLSAVCLLTVRRLSVQGASVMVCLSLAVTAVSLFINGAVFFSLFNSSFFLCDYFFVSGRYLTFRHLVACSQQYMNRKNTLLTGLKLSFTGWFLLCFLIIPTPYVWGYYNQALAVAAADFMTGKE